MTFQTRHRPCVANELPRQKCTIGSELKGGDANVIRARNWSFEGATGIGESSMWASGSLRGLLPDDDGRVAGILCRS